jgi:hypothetical protein
MELACLPGIQLAIALANVINRSLKNSLEFFDERILASPTAQSACAQFAHDSFFQLSHICAVVLFSLDAASWAARRSLRSSRSRWALESLWARSTSLAGSASRAWLASCTRLARETRETRLSSHARAAWESCIAISAGCTLIMKCYASNFK